MKTCILVIIGVSIGAGLVELAKVYPHAGVALSLFVGLFAAVPLKVSFKLEARDWKQP